MNFDFQPDSSPSFDFQPDEDKENFLSKYKKELADNAKTFLGYIGQAEGAVHSSAEAAAQTAKAFATPFVALPAAALQSINDVGQGQSPAFLKHYEENQNYLPDALVPKSEEGKDKTKAISELSNYWLNPLLGHIGNFHYGQDHPTAKLDFRPDVLEKNFEAAKQVPKGKGLNDEGAVNDAVLAKKQAVKLQQPQPDGLSTNDPFTQMKQQLQTPQTNEGPFIDPATLKERQVPDQVFNRMAQDAGDSGARDAQSVIDERQKQMEQEVAQKAGLDFNAAERTRQEAPVQDLSKQDIPNRPISENPGDNPQAPFVPKNQRGAINPDVFKEGFQKLKQLADGTWLRAYEKDGSLQIDAVKDSKVRSAVTFDAHDVPELKDKFLDAFSVATRPEDRHQGLATEMYKFASELGNDITPSFAQTTAGKQMWEGFNRKGMVSDGVIKSPGNKQTGAIMLSPKDAGKAKFLSDHPSLKLKTIVPDKWTPEQAIDAIKATKDVDQNFLQKAANYFTKGGIYQSLKTDHPLVKYTTERMMNADRLARGDVQTWVHDKLAPAARALNNREAAEVWRAIQRADLHKVPLSEDILRANGANEKQIAYFNVHQEAMSRAFDGINRVLDSLGMDHIDQRTAYAAMKATGNYRRLVYRVGEDGEKHVVGIVGSDFRHLLNKRIEALNTQHPEYIVGKEEYFGGVPRDKGNAAAAMAHNLELLSKNDPRIKEFLDVYDHLTTNEVYNFLNMKRHTMDKKGVFGMEGRKDWISAEQNAREGMQAQNNYMESVLKWERMADSAKDVQTVLRDTSVSENHPNAVAWSDYYMKNAMGFNPSDVGHALEQAFAKGFGKVGVGYGVARKTIAVTRKVINMTLLGLNPAFLLTNVVQPLMAMPGMKGYLASKGVHTTFDGGTGLAYFTKAMTTVWKEFADKNNEGVQYLSKVEKGALDYARTHHVYGSDLIEHTNRAQKDLPYYMDKIGGLGSGAVESSTRKSIYLAFTHMLDENGLSVKDGLYEAAHNLTDMAMNNYSTLEKPKAYNSAGPLGSMAYNLSSYKHNELSRLALFVRQIGENEGLANKTRPLLSQLGASVAFAGILGTIAWDQADWLVQHISKLVGHPMTLTEAVIKLSEQVNKSAGGSEKSDYILSHGMFSLLGIDMSKRLGVNNIIGNSVADTGFPGISSLGQSATSIGTAVMHPTEMNAKRAVRDFPILPQPARTNMDLEWFSKNNGKLGMSTTTDKATIDRTDGDVLAKRLGFTGIHESVTKDKRYQVSVVNQMMGDLRKQTLDEAKDEFFSKGNINPKTVEKYLKYEGDPKTFVADVMRYAKEQSVPQYQRDLLEKAAAKSITSLRQAQRLQDAYQR
jgi:hypothetical protein